jgi:hypothetical protein
MQVDEHQVMRCFPHDTLLIEITIISNKIISFVKKENVNMTDIA